jgi:hypothetical protein
MPLWLTLVLVVVIGAGIVVVIAVAGSRAGQRRGYSGMGGETVVRCNRGHLFTTVWIPGSSLKAVRLGYRRYQRCPVCGKWRMVEPVADAELTDEDRRTAAEHHTGRLP